MSTAISSRVCKPRQRGFTLIEILVALSIFAILASITSGVLYHTFDIQARVEKMTTRFNEISLALALVRNTTAQSIARPVRGNEMLLFPAFMGQPQYAEWSYAGVQVQRVGLMCEKGRLVQRRFEALDTLDRHRVRDRVLLDHLNDCQLAYINAQHTSVSTWESSPDESNKMPLALQLKIVTPDLGKASFLFLLPSGSGASL